MENDKKKILWDGDDLEEIKDESLDLSSSPSPKDEEIALDFVKTKEVDIHDDTTMPADSEFDKTVADYLEERDTDDIEIELDFQMLPEVVVASLPKVSHKPSQKQGGFDAVVALETQDSPEDVDDKEEIETTDDNSEFTEEKDDAPQESYQDFEVSLKNPYDEPEEKIPFMKRITSKIKGFGKGLANRLLLLPTKTLVFHMVVIAFFAIGFAVVRSGFMGFGLLFSLFWFVLGLYEKSAKPIFVASISLFLVLWIAVILLSQMEDFFPGIISVGIPLTIATFFLILFVGYLLFSKDLDGKGDFVGAGISSVIFLIITTLIMTNAPYDSILSGEGTYKLLGAVGITVFVYTIWRFIYKHIKKNILAFLDSSYSSFKGWIKSKKRGKKECNDKKN